MLMIQQLVGERVPETVWHLLVEAPKKLNTTWLISYIMGVFGDTTYTSTDPLFYHFSSEI